MWHAKPITRVMCDIVAAEKAGGKASSAAESATQRQGWENRPGKHQAIKIMKTNFQTLS